MSGEKRLTALLGSPVAHSISPAMHNMAFEELGIDCHYEAIDVDISGLEAKVRELVDSIIQTGYVVKPYIGVSVIDVSQESLGYGLPAGASVQGVVEDSPAHRAGLNISDIITHVNGNEITGASDLKKMVNASCFLKNIPCSMLYFALG